MRFLMCPVPIRWLPYRMTLEVGDQPRLVKCMLTDVSIPDARRAREVTIIGHHECK